MLTKSLFTLAAAFMTAGCFAVTLPEVKDPAPDAELQRVLSAADRAVNPAGKKVRSVQLKTIGHIAKMSMMLTMEVFCRYDRHQMREKSSAPGMPAIFELFDGKKGWHIIQGVQTKELTGKKLALLRFAASTHDGMKFAEKYEDIKLDRNLTDVNGKKCYRLVARPKGEPELLPQEWFIDAETFLPVRECVIAHTDMGDVPSTTDFLRFRTQDGMQIPEMVKVTQLNMEITVKVMECRYDVEIPDKTFDREAIEDEE